ncbi:hypothetical protein [Streptomyces sp. C8S0]|uniref:hypothetical protein n=1 Tax=Streptomyces sp. C8S0 TaxID=2585716 RepID=UPI001866ED82|nr:hypothetical protein [Streptomyces sp. C8S0]
MRCACSDGRVGERSHRLVVVGFQEVGQFVVGAADEEFVPEAAGERLLDEVHEGLVGEQRLGEHYLDQGGEQTGRFCFHVHGGDCGQAQPPPVGVPVGALVADGGLVVGQGGVCADLDAQAAGQEQRVSYGEFAEEHLECCGVAFRGQHRQPVVRAGDLPVDAERVPGIAACGARVAEGPSHTVGVGLLGVRLFGCCEDVCGRGEQFVDDGVDARRGGDRAEQGTKPGLTASATRRVSA